MKTINYFQLALLLLLSLAVSLNASAQSYSGGAGTELDPYQIANKADLQYLSENSSQWGNHFLQTAEIVFSATDFTSGGDFYNANQGFIPIGDNSTAFTGSYKGQSFKIKNLQINRTTIDRVGFFGTTSGATLANIALENVAIAGRDFVGGLVGNLYGGSTINNCYAGGTVQATGDNAGGLVGKSENLSTISNSYATVAVSGSSYVGGLLGQSANSTISYAYAIGEVNGSNNDTGGLIGCIDNNSSVSNSYATGKVNGANNVGGLVGRNNFCAISRCYAIGKVTGASFVGGLVGGLGGASKVTESFWDTESSTQSSSKGGTGKTTAEMQTQSTFTNWLFPTDWKISANAYPILSYQADNQVVLPTISSYTPALITRMLSTATISAVPSAGTVQWFTTETGGTAIVTGGDYVLSGNSLQVANISTGTLFYAEALDGDNHSDSRTAVGITVVYAGGDGSEGNPYQIETRNDLKFVSENTSQWSNKHFKQIADIVFDASDFETKGSFYNNGEGFSPIGTINIPFRGFYNGQNFKIGKLKINRPTANQVGLFGRTSNVSLSNIVLEDADIRGNNEVGGIVGQSINMLTISNSLITGSINGNSKVGGLAGFIQPGQGGNTFNINNSYSACAVAGTDYVGGLIGSAYNAPNSTISNAYAVGMVSGSPYSGGLVGRLEGGSVAIITNSFWDMQTTGQSSSDRGGTGKTTAEMRTQSTFTAWDFSNVWKMGQCTNNGYPVFQGQSITAYPTITATTQSFITRASTSATVSATPSAGTIQWFTTQTGGTALADGTDYTLSGNDLTINHITATTTFYAEVSDGVCINPERTAVTATVVYAGGTGTAQDPYQIANKTDLQYLSENISQWEKHFIQTADIVFDASDFAIGGAFYNNGEGFIPIGNGSGEHTAFYGSYNGQNFKIKNLKINRPDYDTGQHIGLFGSAEGATLANIAMENVDITGSMTVGGLAGSLYFSTLSNSYATGVVQATNGSVGGLVGYNSDGTISNSYATGAVNGSYDVGGLVGSSDYGTISYAYAIGEVNGSSNYIGGLIGNVMYGSVANSYATGKVNGANNVGGLLGSNNGGTISRCYATGKVTGASFVGGLVGESMGGTATNSFWDTETTGKATSAGGGTGKTTADMRTQSTFTEWDFSNVWKMGQCTNNGYPVFQGQSIIAYPTITASTPAFITRASSSVTVSATPSAGTIQWFTTQTGGTALANGADYILNGNNLTINNITATATFYAEVVDGACSNPIRTAVTATMIYAGGDGSVGTPYQIANKTDLKYLSENTSQWSSHFIQTADIVFDASDFAIGGAFYNNGEGFIPIGNGSTYFTGSYKGQNSKIKNLKINRTDDITGQFIGLFGNAEGATLANIALENVDITGSYIVGGLAGGLYSSSLSNSYVTGTVSGSSDVGGLVGSCSDGTITNSYANGAVSGSSRVGGLVGSNNNGTISNSYATGAVSGSSYVGGLVGIGQRGTITNSYATGAVSGQSKVGGLVGGSMPSITVVNSFWDTETTGQATSAGGGTGKTTAQMRTQSTFANWEFSNVWKMGQCTNNGYPVFQGQSIIAYPTITASTPAFITRASSSVTVSATPSAGAIQWFTTQTGGTALANGADYILNGNNLTINNLTANTIFYAEVADGACTNPVRTAVTVTVVYAGGAGTAQDPYQIANKTDLQYLSENISQWEKHFIQTADIVFDASDFAIGSAFYNNGEGFIPIGNDNSRGAPFTGSYKGQSFKIKNLKINRPTSVNEVGLFGRTSGATLANIALENVDITGNSYVGGLVGGLVSGSTLNNCYVTGTVSGQSMVGGLVGNAGGAISNCYTALAVSGTSYVGGLVGYANGTIANSYATGVVSGSANIGGLVGYVNGNSGGTIANSYATGAVNGSDYVGGLVGNNQGTISKSYATGKVTGVNAVGGLVGFGQSLKVTDSFWDTESSTLLNSKGGTGKTTADMRTQSTFANWDFTAVWKMGQCSNNGYPVFQGQSITPYPSITANPALITRASASATISATPSAGTVQWFTTQTGGTALVSGGDYTVNGNNLTINNLTANTIFYAEVADGACTNPVRTAVTVTVVYAGGAGTAQDPYQIANKTDLQYLSENISQWEKHFIQTADIVFDASDFAIGGAFYNNREGFIPIGNGSGGHTAFYGSYKGQNFKIKNLKINRTDVITGQYIGLFGRAEGATLANIALENVAITGSETVGGLAGGLYSSTLSNSYATGVIQATNSSVGGLVGYNSDGTISNSHATGAVSGQSEVGGLVGKSDGTITNSYATGAVSGQSEVGGLVGSSDGTITNSYATGAVSGSSRVGGLLGESMMGNIINSYATGAVSGSSRVGGLLGESMRGTITNSFWDIQTTGQLISAGGGEGKTTADMRTQSTFTNWDFSTVWKMGNACANNGYPVFAGQVTVPLAGISSIQGLAGSTYTVSATAYQTGAGITYQWENNINGQGWTALGTPSATYTDYTATAETADNAKTQWRLAVNCSSAIYSNTVEFTTLPMCITDNPGPLTSTLGGITDRLTADDFTVQPYQKKTIARVSLRILNEINKATLINFYEDNNGIPGNLLKSYTNIAPASTTLVGDFYGQGNVYLYRFDLPEHLGLSGGSTGKQYWVVLQFEQKAPLIEPYWEYASAVSGHQAQQSTDGGNTWFSISSTNDLAFALAGTCEAECGTVPGGTTTATPAKAIAGTAYTLSATGYGTGPYLTYQWQSNTNNAGWQNEGTVLSAYADYSATAPALGTSVGWRLLTLCNGQVQAYADVATFVTDYCQPSFNNFYYMDDVVLNGENSTAINDTDTKGSSGGYDDRTAQTIDLMQGVTYTSKIKTNANDFNIGIWIDADNAGNFVLVGQGKSLNDKISPIPLTIPANIGLGLHRMRMMLVNGTLDACNSGNSYAGEVHDYTVNMVAEQACTANLNGGTALLSAKYIAQNSTYTVSAEDYSPNYQNVAYQWEYRYNTGTWTAVGNPSATYTAYTATAPAYATLVDWRLKVTCSASGETAYSALASFSSLQYGVPAFAYNCEGGDVVDDFVLNGENGTKINDLGTGCSTDAYRDASNQTVDLTKGASYQAQISSQALYDEHFAVWINFNENDPTDFTLVGSGSFAGNSPINFNIAIPADAPLGRYRMRVMVAYGGNPTDPSMYSPMNNGTDPREFGEVHDYTVNIVGPPVLPITLSSFTAQKQLDKVLLKWQISSASNHQKFVLERSADGFSYHALTEIPFSGIKTYQFTDRKPMGGLNYYRLLSIDKDGKQQVFGPKAVDFGLDGRILLYENPAYKEVTLKIPSLLAGHWYQVLIVDASGRLVKNLRVTSSALQDGLLMDVGALASGVYQVIIHNQTTGTRTGTVKLVKL